MEATFIGPKAKMTLAGLTFLRDVPRPIPETAQEALAGHPWFIVIGEAKAPVGEPVKARRGRPRKEVTNDAE